MTHNQIPEQIARDTIDQMLRQAGWAVQNMNTINPHDGLGQAVREYQRYWRRWKGNKCVNR